MKYRIEIRPPDISGYRNGNAGVDYVHILDSGNPGPTVTSFRERSRSTFFSKKKWT
jgi:hypothetical protein